MHCAEPAVCLFADSAFFNERVEDDRAVDEAASEVEVLHHLVRIDQELVDDAGESLEHVVQSDSAVRQDDAFDRRMGNVAFVPEGDVFQSSLGIAADDAGQAAHAFTSDRIAFVRHDGRAFLFGAEVFFGFADFRALEVTDFRSHLVDGAGNDSQGRYVFSMAVALQGLRRNRRSSDARCSQTYFSTKGSMSA